MNREAIHVLVERLWAVLQDDESSTKQQWREILTTELTSRKPSRSQNNRTRLQMGSDTVDTRDTGSNTEASDNVAVPSGATVVGGADGSSSRTHRRRKLVGDSKRRHATSDTHPTHPAKRRRTKEKHPGKGMTKALIDQLCSQVDGKDAKR